MPRQIVLAEEAGAARDRKRHHHAIAALKFGHAGAVFLDHAHEFVAEHHVVQLRQEAVVDVQVRAADRGGGDAQNDVVRLLDLGIGDVIDGDFAGMMEDKCFHRGRLEWDRFVPVMFVSMTWRAASKS